MKRVFIVGGSILFLLALIIGAYFFTHRDKIHDLVAEKDKLQTNLALAQEKLNKEKKALEAMRNNLRNSFPFGSNIQDQMKKASSIVGQTDFMFSDPNGSSPEIIVKNPFTNILINDERKDINTILLKWQEKSDVYSVGKITINEGERIKQDAETIKSFMEDLAEILSGLTSENSGLSEFQIYVYLSQLPSIESINEVLASLEAAIENANINSQASASVPTNTQTNNQNNSGTQNNQNTSNNNNSNTNSNTPPATQEEIVEAETQVAGAQAEVFVLQEKLTQIEQQLQQLYPTSDPTTNPNPTNSSPENPDTTTYDGYNPNFGNPSNREILNQGIIVQPGAPVLIPGTDPF